jgi:5-formyltetrahydrofolate cyclo-ligase
LNNAKVLAREQAKRRREKCDPTLGEKLSRQVLESAIVPRHAVVAGFWPVAGEINILPLLHALAERGHALALPETTARGNPLIFRAWTPRAKLVPGRFGTQHPSGDVLRPDFILVPLLAFDALGNRLGYGGGYYDRTLAELPEAFWLGCAFAAQEVLSVPVEANDLPLHAVATELGVRRF